jgi:hypothetical protein
MRPNEGYTRYGDMYDISNMCMQSYPCQHLVCKVGATTARVMDGMQIYAMLQREGIEDVRGHFACYAPPAVPDWFKTAVEDAAP